MDDAVWVPTVFSKNRDRLIEHDAVVALFNEVLAQVDREGWLSGEHFSVDGALIQAWAGRKSFARKDGEDEDGGDFRGQPRSNEAHASTTDADARLYRKGNTASELRYMGHALSDNRHGLIANARVTQADGHAEREAAKAMIGEAVQAAPEGVQVTLGADKGYDAAEFVEALQALKVTIGPSTSFNIATLDFAYASGSDSAACGTVPTPSCACDSAYPAPACSAAERAPGPPAALRHPPSLATSRRTDQQPGPNS